VCSLFLSPQSGVGPSISSSVVRCSVFLLVCISVPVLSVYLYQSSLRVGATFCGAVLFPLLCSVFPSFSPTHWFFSLSNFVIPSKCLKISSVLLLNVVPLSVQFLLLYLSITQSTKIKTSDTYFNFCVTNCILCTVSIRSRLRWSRGSVLAFNTQVRGFKPSRSRRIFKGEKILSTPSFGGEVKPSVTCRRFAACKRSLNGMEVVISSKLLDNILVHISHFRRWDLSRRGGRGGTWWWKVGTSKKRGKQWQATPKNLLRMQ